MKPAAQGAHYDQFKANWLTLGVYERFEQVVALVISSLVALVVAVAVWRLFREVLFLLFVAGSW